MAAVRTMAAPVARAMRTRSSSDGSGRGGLGDGDGDRGRLQELEVDGVVHGHLHLERGDDDLTGHTVGRQVGGCGAAGGVRVEDDLSFGERDLIELLGTRPGSRTGQIERPAPRPQRRPAIEDQPDHRRPDGGHPPVGARRGLPRSSRSAPWLRHPGKAMVPTALRRQVAAETGQR
jgi:hypothetical protein